jgi:PhoH-like ATPase
LTGDVEQIDHVYVDATSNGLTVAVERFKEYGITGHITLKRGERSEVASMAVEAL